MFFFIFVSNQDIDAPSLLLLPQPHTKTKVHYTLGGIAIDTHGRVKRTGGGVVEGLWAAGEITGGVHGVNRLGGNALTECVVFGQIVGETIDVGVSAAHNAGLAAAGDDGDKTESDPVPKAKTKTKISASELALHKTKEDCWIAVYGDVYDFTSFVDEHPGGPESMVEYAGESLTWAAYQSRP